MAANAARVFQYIFAAVVCAGVALYLSTPYAVFVKKENVTYARLGPVWGRVSYEDKSHTVLLHKYRKNENQTMSWNGPWFENEEMITGMSLSLGFSVFSLGAVIALLRIFVSVQRSGQNISLVCLLIGLLGSIIGLSIAAEAELHQHRLIAPVGISILSGCISLAACMLWLQCCAGNGRISKTPRN